MHEQTYLSKDAGKLCRPFQRAAQIECRGYSQRLQRVITDFGADVAFGRVAEKVQEHYGITLAVSAAVTITERHARQITESDMTPARRVARAPLTLIAQTDGSMIPLIQPGVVAGQSSPADRRKTRSLFWKEAKLSLVRRVDELTPVFAVTLGDPAAAGADLKRLALSVGFCRTSRVHAVGDGAQWIVEQMEQQFGAQGNYLVDIYHVCDYLAAAAPACASNDPGWVTQQKERLKTNQLPAVMAALDPFQETQTPPGAPDPVRRCYRYLANRPGQFEYHAAILAKLPIGSGEVESAHRYIIQERLKLAGAWWLASHAQYMLNLRVARANGGWQNYWDTLAA